VDKKVVIFPVILTALVIPLVFVIADISGNHDVRTIRETEWSIGIYQGKTPFDLDDFPGVTNPVIKASDVNDVKAKFVADPFLYKKIDTWYMFFEVFNELSDQGDIGVAVSNDLTNWKYEKIVLDEPFHISYPFVFESQGAIYMIPESAEAKELRLYKAAEFPYRWQYVKTMLKGDFGDHALIQYKNIWWLFAGSDPYHNSSLRLFYADSILGEWKEHLESPIVSHNANKARPGGRMIIYNDILYRFAQDCDPTYGLALNAFEVVSLTKDGYREKNYQFNPILKPHGKGWARHGMHQLDVYQIEKEKWIGCVDGYRKDFVLKVDY
jgi:hypothetical protein